MTNAGDLPDMEQVYNEYFSPVYNYVFYRLLSREDTQDVVSQVFLKVCAGLSGYDPQRASLRTWIFRITDHALIDFYRRRKPVMSLDSGEPGLQGALYVHFDEQYDRHMAPARKAVLAALRQLSEQDRTFIYYKYYLGITNREIARRMGMNENTIASILSRARQKLRGMLADEV